MFLEDADRSGGRHRLQRHVQMQGEVLKDGVVPPGDTRAGYTGVAKLLHLLVLALLLAEFAIAWTMPNIGRGSVPIGLIGWHLSAGLTILAVMLVRLAWRLTHSVPAAPNDLPRALALLSRISHYLLYAVLIVLPLLGWANASARGWAVRLFGVVPLPPLTMKGSALGHQLGNVHATLATVLLAIVALHVAGALFLKDRTMQRMLPDVAATERPRSQDRYTKIAKPVSRR